MRKVTTKQLVRAAVIACLYAVLCLVPGLNLLAFGPIQFRVAEALTVLPILFPEAILGLYVGVILANIFGGFGLVDIILGSFITLVAAYCTRKTKDIRWKNIRILAFAAPVVLNGLGVSAYLYLLVDLPYWYTAIAISLGEAAVVWTLGFFLLRQLEKLPNRKFYK